MVGRIIERLTDRLAGPLIVTAVLLFVTLAAWYGVLYLVRRSRAGD